MRALDERPPWVEQPEEGVTYAHKIEAADRALDPTRRPRSWSGSCARCVRTSAPGCRCRTDAASACSPPASTPLTPAPAGGRVHAEDDRLLLDCRGGVLELTEIRPPGGRPMPAQAWLRGRPDAALTDFWLDPRLPGREAGPHRDDGY